MAQALSRRTGSVRVLYINLDDFKTINATLGHDAGDELLRETARCMHKTLRAADTPARLGRDVFAVMVVDLEVPDHAGVGLFSVYLREMEVAR
jgi:diguanylate cyclase (GGDEF)-like protein